MSHAVEWALHVCSLLALTPAGHTVPAAKLAEFHDVPPAYLAKHLQALAKAGIVEPAYGKNGGYRLARPSTSINLLDIVDAVEGSERAFRCAEIRRNGPCGRPDAGPAEPCAFASAMWDAEQAWRDHLAGVSLDDVTRRMLVSLDPVEQRLGRDWIGANARSPASFAITEENR